jgi:hypothetical protein
VSPELVLLLINGFYYRWNQQQQMRFHGSPAAFRNHFEHWVLEELQLLTHDWYDEPLFPTWRSTKDFADTGEKFGVVPRQQPAVVPRQQPAEQGEGGGGAGQEEGKKPDDEDGPDDAEEDEEEEAELLELEEDKYLEGLPKSSRCVLDCCEWADG